MAAGRPPFRGDTRYGIIRRIVERSATPLREIDAKIPSWFQNLVDPLQAKDPGDRIPTAGREADLMEACLAHVQTGSAQSPVELARPSRKRRRVRELIIAVIVIAAATGLLWLVVKNQTTDLRDADIMGTGAVDAQLQAVESEVDALPDEVSADMKPVSVN